MSELVNEISVYSVDPTDDTVVVGSRVHAEGTMKSFALLEDIEEKNGRKKFLAVFFSSGQERKSRCLKKIGNLYIDPNSKKAVEVKKTQDGIIFPD